MIWPGRIGRYGQPFIIFVALLTCSASNWMALQSFSMTCMASDMALHTAAYGVGYGLHMYMPAIHFNNIVGLVIALHIEWHGPAVESLCVASY